MPLGLLGVWDVEQLWSWFNVYGRNPSTRAWPSTWLGAWISKGFLLYTLSKCGECAAIRQCCRSLLGDGGDKSSQKRVVVGLASHGYTYISGWKYCCRQVGRQAARDGVPQRVWRQPPSSLISSLLQDAVEQFACVLLVLLFLPHVTKKLYSSSLIVL